MTEQQVSTRTGTLFGGIVLIAFGVIFLLDRAGVDGFSDVFRRYWPMMVIAWAIMKILNGEIWPGLWFLAVGAWFQLVTLHAFGLTYGSSWPFLLVVIGAGMVVRALAAAMRSRSRVGGEHRNES